MRQMAIKRDKKQYPLKQQDNRMAHTHEAHIVHTIKENLNEQERTSIKWKVENI